MKPGRRDQKEHPRRNAMERKHEAAVATERNEHMHPRMKNPAMILPEAAAAIQALGSAVYKGGVPRATLDLVHPRVSQITGCRSCVDAGSRAAKQAGETDDRLFTVAAWRHAPHFSDAERSALALGEAETRLADHSDPVPDDIWNEAARHYDEKGL